MLRPIDRSRWRRLLVTAMVAAVLALAGRAPAVGQVVRPPEGGGVVSLAEAQVRLEALVRYLAQRGITLSEGADGWWSVARPPSEGYTIVVALRVYPPDASERQMKDDLARINLAFMLNGSARIAMSYPGIHGDLPDGTRLRDLPVREALIKAFQRYRAPRATR